MSQMLKSRSICTKVVSNPRQWSITQVTKSNFPAALEEIKNNISVSDFLAVSLQKTGSFSSPWHRVLPFDTADTAYLKAKYAAERFQPLQFAICPFSIRASKVVAYPYNFHLFPRDELRMGMPSYTFSYQTSYLTSMAQQGFDFNICINDGISYLSRSQEAAAKVKMGNSIAFNEVFKQSSNTSIADAVFIERIKSRVKHWRNTCNDSSKRLDEAFVRSLRKIVTGSEEYRSRPCLNIDVCSERQVQLTVEMLKEISDDLIPLKIPAMDGGTQAVRVVLTKSKEDKDRFESELQELEEEQNKGMRGFREVIELISASQKPVISYGSLNDFTFIHEKFLAPLPHKMNDFRSSLRMAFPHVIDVNHLMKEVGHLKNANNLPAAIHNLKRRFFVPIDMEIPHIADSNEGKISGNSVLRVSQLFTQICSILKINPDTLQAPNHNCELNLQDYENIFTPCSTQPLEAANEENITVWTNSTRKVSSQNLVFLWGFKHGTPAGVLKEQLRGTHTVFSEEFDVRLVDKTCAVIVFWRSGLSDTFIEAMGGKEIYGSLKEMVSEGVKVAGYEVYERICRLGLWETELADSFDNIFADPKFAMDVGKEKEFSTIHASIDAMVYLDDMIYLDDL